MKYAIIVLLVVSLLIVSAGCVQLPAAPSGTGAPNASGQQGAGTGTGQPPAPMQGAGNGTTGGTPAGIEPSGQPPAQTGPAMPAGERISLTTDDSWKINGTLYKSKNSPPKAGIVLLPQLGSDRSSYDALVPVLHDELPDADVLAIDMRGQGESINIGKYTTFIMGDYKAMSKDVKAAVKYLGFFRHTPDNYYLVGASMGGTAAILYASQDSAVQKVVLISPGMDYQGVDITSALQDVRKIVYFTASEGDYASAADAQTAYSTSNAYVKELLIYRTTGAAHGTDMFAASENSSEGSLAEKIAGWLK